MINPPAAGHLSLSHRESARTPFARLPYRRPTEAIAVTIAGETQIFPNYAALRDAVLTQEQPLIDRWIAAEVAKARTGERVRVGVGLIGVAALLGALLLIGGAW